MPVNSKLPHMEDFVQISTLIAALNSETPYLDSIFELRSVDGVVDGLSRQQVVGGKHGRPCCCRIRTGSRGGNG
jgi:hypothetical protein